MWQAKLPLWALLALADVYRDATAVIDVLGWDPETTGRETSFEISLTSAHIEQIHKRRCDLLDTNLDLLTDIGADRKANDFVMAEIHANRRATEALNVVFDADSQAVTGRNPG
jgi:hypothetical protein